MKRLRLGENIEKNKKQNDQEDEEEKRLRQQIPDPIDSEHQFFQTDFGSFFPLNFFPARIPPTYTTAPEAGQSQIGGISIQSRRA